MKRLAILIACCLLPFFALKAQQQGIAKSDIIETYKGKPYYIHFVKAGETLQAISLVYSVSNQEITEANPAIKDGLQANQVIKIPVKAPDQSAGQEVVQPSVEKQEIKPVVIPETRQEPKPETPQQTGQEVTSGGGQFHRVEPRETWYGLARMYEIPMKELISANPGVDTLRIGMTINIPGKVAMAPEKVSRKGYEIHVVLPHETLYSLSKMVGLSVEELIGLNPELSDGLKTGQSIYIPLAGSPVAVPSIVPQKQDQPAFIEHIVARKETLYSISKKYNVDISDILKANPGIENGLGKGDVLRIPQKTAGAEKRQTEVEPVVAPEAKPEIEKPVERRDARPCGKATSGNQEFHVALLIPFQLEEADSINTGDAGSLKLPSDYQSLDFIQFYEGALLAVDSLKNAGLKCKVYVYDADAGEHVSKTRKIIAKPEFSEMDLIIGPFFTKSFDLVSDFAAKHSIPVVNPLSQRSEILKDNPYVFKAQPSAWGQYNETARYIAQQYAGANVILLRRNADENSKMAGVMQTSIGKHSAGAMKVKDVSYSQSGDAGMFKSMVAGKKNVIVLLTADKALLPALLRKLNDSRDKYEITLFGLPEWENMDMDITYLLNLNTHLFSPWFVDYSNPDVKKFVGKFRERFKAEPEKSEQAFLGYDLGFYFIGNLMNYGKDFTKCLSSNDHRGLSTGFTFWKTDAGGYENSATSVYQLKDYRRQVVNR